MRQLALVAVMCSAWVTSAYASPPLAYHLSAPGAHRALDDHTLYEVKFTCHPGSGLSADSASVLDRVVNWFAHQNESANHYLIISNDVAQPDPSAQGKIKLPAKAVFILPVFSIKNDSVISNIKSCPDSIYVEGSQKLYLIPTISWSSEYTEGPALAGLYQATKLISPIWSIFNPESIPAAIASKITNAQATEAPIKDILTKMNKDKDYGESVRLKQGRYVITTRYSTVTMQVSRLSSVVKAPSSDLRRDFRDALDAAPQKISATDNYKACDEIATTLADEGFSEKEDIPYALTYLASK